MAQRFQTLKGFRDFYPADCAARNYVFDVWRRIARRYGFVEYEGPILEPTDLYRKKSGDEIAGQLFCFEDKGGRDVSMRPELTPTLARMAAGREREFKKPLRWFSIGQFFRYEKHQKGRGREFYQFNCDILGETSPLADAELMALSIDLMLELGFTKSDFRIRVSDRNAWVSFATEKGVADDRITGFLQIVDKMERTPKEKTEELLGELNLTLSDIEGFIASGAEASPALKEILSNLKARGFEDYVEVDLSIVRGLAYYTGAVFEIFDVGKGMRAVAGGGRYDQLVGLIGGVDMAACGFAMGDMVITDLIRESERPNQLLDVAVACASGVDISIVIADEEKQGEAASVVQQLRESGYRVIAPFSPAKIGKQFQAAEQAGAKLAIVVGGEYPQLTAKRLEDRFETTVDVAGLSAAVADLLGE